MTRSVQKHRALAANALRHHCAPGTLGHQLLTAWVNGIRPEELPGFMRETLDLASCLADGFASFEEEIRLEARSGGNVWN